METKRTENENGVVKRKTGTVGGQWNAPVASHAAARAAGRRAVRAAKSDVAYWRDRVRPRIFTATDGSRRQTPELYVRIKESGRDVWVCLDTANRGVAAAKARDIWIAIRAEGAAAFLAKRRPPKPDRVATVGELITLVEGLAQVRPRTLAQYSIALRRVVSGVLKIPGSPERYAAKSAANAAWRARVEGVPLDRLSPGRVEAWRASEIAAAGNEAERKARVHSTASNIRNCRAFFSKRLTPILREKLNLPTPLPFEGLTARSTTRRFESTVDPRHLYESAKADFYMQPDILTAFMLLVVGGLRRGEADLLPWANVDLGAKFIKVATTAWFSPKSSESQRTVPLPDDFVVHLAGRHNPAAEFVLEGRKPKAPGKSYEYRAFAWNPLIDWLRAQGISSRNPLHELRKISGSFVNEKGGLEAARRHLGHASVITTSASYVQAKPVVVDFSL